MKCLVTGAAGFIGSHLCERLLQLGHAVAGLDAFIPYYPRAVKDANLAGPRSHPGFTLFPIDLRDADLAPARSTASRSSSTWPPCPACSS